MRTLFLTLLAVNAIYFGWHYAYPPDKEVRLSRVEPDVKVVGLVNEIVGTELTGMVSSSMGRPPAKPDVQPEVTVTKSPEPQEPASAAVDIANESNECISIGPIKVQATGERIADVLKEHKLKFHQRALKETQTEGYWVYLPPLDTRDEALAVSRKLSDESVQDYYIVAQKEHENAISLGLFPNETSANRRVDLMKSLGYKPKIDVREHEMTVYWFDLDAQSSRKVLNEPLQAGLGEALGDPKTVECGSG